MTICEGVQRIGEYAFEKCRKMEKIVLPDSIRRIDKGAFFYCDELDSLELPEGVDIDGISDIVRNCFHLRKLILPRSLTFVKKFEWSTVNFTGCNSISILVYPSLNLEDLSDKLVGAAISGFTCFYERFTDPRIREQYIALLMKKKAQLFNMILRYDEVSLLQMMADQGKITKKDFDATYLEPAVAAKAVQCTQFLLNWKSANVKPPKDLSAALDKELKEKPKDPYNATDMKKLWGSGKTEDGTLVLNSYKGTEVDVELPPRIGKNPVTKVGDHLFSDFMRSGDNTLKSKPYEKRLHQATIRSIRVPEGVREIDDCAFDGCKALEHLYLPGTVENISPVIFYTDYRTMKVSENLTIHAPAGSYAETYAKEHEISFAAE